MGNEAVTNTGPIIHLTEINLIKALDIFSALSIPNEVSNELQKAKIKLPKNIKIILLKAESKNTARILVDQHDLQLGESEAIALALQEKSDFFLTDDLDARNVSKEYNLETHGTVGIILRAYREGIINKEVAIDKIRELQEKSSLFITSDLVARVIKAIKDFSYSERH